MTLREQPDVEGSRCLLTPGAPEAGGIRIEPRRSLVVRELAVGAVLLLALVLPTRAMFAASAADQDEGTLLEYPVLVLHGWIPDADFETAYGPASVWVPAAADIVAGSSVRTERLVGLAYRAVLLLGLYLLGRRWGRPAGLAGALLGWAVLMPFGSTAYPWVGGAAFAVLGVAILLPVLDRRDAAGSRRRAVLAGLVCGIGLLFRPDLALAVGLAGGAAALVLGTALWRFGAGLLLGASPYAVLIAQAGPGAVLRGVLVDPVFKMAPARVLPVPPSPHRISDFFGNVAAIFDGHGAWKIASLPLQLDLLFWVLVALEAALVILAIVSVAKRGRGGVPITIVAAFGLGLVPYLLQRLDASHLVMVGSIWAACLPLIAVEARGLGAGRTTANRSPGARPERTAAAVTAAGLGALVLGVAAPFFIAQQDVLLMPWSKLPATRPVVHRGRVLPVPASGAATFQAAVQAVADRSRPGQRLFIGPADLRRTVYGDTELYWLLPQLEPATRYLEFNPGIANTPGSGLARQLATARWVLLDHSTDAWVEPNASMLDGPSNAQDTVARHFCLVWHDAPFDLYEHRRPTGACPAA